MINWLRRYIGTGSYLQVMKDIGDFIVVDVRNLVDKDGNTHEAITEKIEESLKAIQANHKVIICCDYGMSRSNAIAAAVISRYEKIAFSEAVSILQETIPESGVKLEVLNDVFKALQEKSVSDQGEPRILISGGSGFIGTQIYKSLSKTRFVQSISTKDVDLTRNPVVLDLLVKENSINTLIHLANPRVYTVNVALGDSLVMLKNVLDICRLNKVRLIYISSWEVYSGYKTEELIADEKLPVFPKGSYGESKWFSEQLIEHYHKLYDLNYTILRSSPVYGEHNDRPKFIYNFIDKAKRNELIQTHQYLNGAPKLDLLYIGDLIEALSKLTEYKVNGIFNIGSGKLVSTKQIANQIIFHLCSKSVIATTKINSYYSNIKMDYSKLKLLTGWQPKESFENFLKIFP